MSIEAVAGRIQEILAMEQQLSGMGAAGAAPSAAATPTSGAASTAVQPTAATATNAPASFSDALATAQGIAATPIGSPSSTARNPPSTAPGAATGPAASSSDPRVQAMINMANSLLGKPYVWGGGHAGFVPNETSLSGFDCSGFVSAVLHAGGYLNAPQTTDTLPGQPGLLSGPGQYVTIYDRTGADGHVIIDIGGQFYESGGGAGSRSGGVEGGLAGGVAKIGQPSDSYLATFGTILHPAGL
jgi:cell wall-associated NlpC family hydrolase